MRHYQEPLQKAAADIAEAVFPFDYRGMRIAMRRVPADAYVRAARALLKQDPGVAVLATGFPVRGTAETDGPPGAAAIGRALQTLGWTVVTVVDLITCPVVAAVLGQFGEIEQLDVSGKAAAKSATAGLLKRIRPDVAIAIERPGLTNDERLTNLRGEDLDHRTVPLDGLFDAPLSIAIGDGGNELGMGTIAGFLRDRGITQTPCVTSATHLLLASVSNWGAYGLVSALEILAKQALAPNQADDHRWMMEIHEAGAVDGITGRSEMTVDTFSEDRTGRVITQLTTVRKSYAQDIGNYSV